MGEVVVLIVIALIVFGPMILKARRSGASPESGSMRSNSAARNGEGWSRPGDQCRRRDCVARPLSSETINMDEFDRIWLDDLADSSKPEPAQEAMLKTRLDDAFLNLPTLEAKQSAVATIEGWAKQFGEDD